jgi:hypothetical protein
VQREKTNFSGVCKSLIIVGKCKWIVGWVGGSILYVFLSSIQLAYVNSPIF